MEILSRDFERELTTKLLQIVNDYLDYKQQYEPRLLGLVSRKELESELGITATTIKKWEKHGLRQYIPPVEDSRTIFYKVSDVLIFLGVENG